MPIWEAVLLGVIQGLTEFLPISSTAHLVVARTLLGHANSKDAFTTVIQLGTLVAVFAYFRTDVGRLMRGIVDDCRARRIGSTAESRLGWRIVLGTIPVGLAGLFLKKEVKDLYNLQAIAIAAICFALLLAASEWWMLRRAQRGEQMRNELEVTWLDALWIGIWQALALIPGGSRSGTTLTGGLFAGLSRPAAARFSFLLSLPAVLAAGLKELYDEYKKIKHPVAGELPSAFESGDEVVALIVGTTVSAIVGYLAIAWLLHFLVRYSTGMFIVYRLLFGTAILIAIAVGYSA